MNYIKAINKILAYSISPLWLSIIIILSINYNILSNTIFWTIALIISLPMGMVFESIYSFIYWNISYLSKKIKCNLPHNIACKRYPKYKDNYNNLENVNYLSNLGYQQLLSENNVLRNLWMSSLVGLIFVILFYYLNNTNTIEETKILIWLPISIPLTIFANIRTEIILKKIKGHIYHFNEIEKNKKLEKE